MMWFIFVLAFTAEGTVLDVIEAPTFPSQAACQSFLENEGNYDWAMDRALSFVADPSATEINFVCGALADSDAI